ncbi:MAG TPA: hypothetical protein VGN97_12240 [Mesorhizobium sp.]|jgi:type II secretory ATPase GspE/PulE/Tfp pilus assembly ATPase PilB-like protein|nr:hypothetical protein [Mesorhizobium sp.]
MSYPGKEAVVSQVLSLTMECGDCGHRCRMKRAELAEFGVTGATRLSEVAKRLVCKECRDEGEPGRNFTIQAAFASNLARLRAEAYLINSREARGSARRARGA